MNLWLSSALLDPFDEALGADALGFAVFGGGLGMGKGEAPACAVPRGDSADEFSTALGADSAAVIRGRGLLGALRGHVSSPSVFSLLGLLSWN
jgi:hypothetical protein